MKKRIYILILTFTMMFGLISTTGRLCRQCRIIRRRNIHKRSNVHDDIILYRRNFWSSAGNFVL